MLPNKPALCGKHENPQYRPTVLTPFTHLPMPLQHASKSRKIMTKRISNMLPQHDIFGNNGQEREKQQEKCADITSEQSTAYMEQAAECATNHRKLPAKRLPFTAQKTVFRNSKGHLSATC